MIKQQELAELLGQLEQDSQHIVDCAVSNLRAVEAINTTSSYTMGQACGELNQAKNYQRLIEGFSRDVSNKSSLLS